MGELGLTWISLQREQLCQSSWSYGTEILKCSRRLTAFPSHTVLTSLGLYGPHYTGVMGLYSSDKEMKGREVLVVEESLGPWRLL